MKNKILIIILIVMTISAILGIGTKYVDGGRVATNNEPKYCIKIVSKDGNKITYWGLGYKVIRYIAVSPNEPYKNNIGAKMGSWFMKADVNVDIKEDNEQYEFVATIIKVSNNSIIVEPDEGTDERKCSDKISMKINRPTNGTNDFYVVGNKIKITYNGIIMESYPAQIVANKIELTN